VPTLQWKGSYLELLDQTKLPQNIEYVRCYNHEQLCEAISSMRVRGAPAIGAAAAFGLVLGALEAKSSSPEGMLAHLKDIGNKLINTRPTAVNLAWSVDRVLKAAEQAANSFRSREEIVKAVMKEAEAIYEEDIKNNRAIGKVGQSVVPEKATILTHCNAGALATVDYGTALGVIRAAKEAGKKVSVFADETRPNLQGARLTTWELLREGIEVTLIVDAAAGYLMQKGLIDLIIVGADRIAANGDVANKIGTYSLAVLAKHHGVPFYVAAPASTFDFSLSDGSEIPIEERGKEELYKIGGTYLAPKEVNVFNPVFDVTPNYLITGIITEFCILKGKDIKNAKAWLKKFNKVGV